MTENEIKTKILQLINTHYSNNYDILEILIDFMKENELSVGDISSVIKSDKKLKKLFLNDLIKNNKIFFEKKIKVGDEEKIIMERPKSVDEII